MPDIYHTATAEPIDLLLRPTKLVKAGVTTSPQPVPEEVEAGFEDVIAQGLWLGQQDLNSQQARNCHI